MAKKPCRVNYKLKGKDYEMTMAEFMTELRNGLLQEMFDSGIIDPKPLKGEFGVAEEPAAPVVPPTVPPTTPIIEEEGEKKPLKSLLGRVVKGVDRARAKAVAEKYGLDYDVESRTDARQSAINFIEELGFDGALEAVRTGVLQDGAAAYVFAELIDQVQTSMESAATEQDMKELVDLQNQLFDEFDKKARSAGRFISSLDDIYRNSKFGYSTEKKIQEYKEKNGGFIPESVENKFKELGDKIKGLNTRIKQLEQQAKKAEEDKTIATVVESVKQKQTAKVSYTQRAKSVADAFRKKLKTNPIQFKDADGNPIDIKSEGVTWNDLVEIGAQAIELSGRIADGVAAIMNKLEDQDWYKSLSEKDKDSVRAQVEGMFSDETEGDIQIPAGMIKSLVESGIDNMTDLVSAVKALISEKYPSATDREIRDAITGYGKEQSKTADEIRDEVNRLKRVGKLISRIEDLQAGILSETDSKRKAEKTEEEKQLTKQVERLMESSGIKNAKRVEQAKLRAAKRIEDLQRRLNEGDFSKKKQTPIAEDEELARLRVEKQNLQDEFDTELYKAELKNRSKWQKLADGLFEVWSIPRALMATGEISFILIQGGIQTLSHPINAARAFMKAVQHFASEKRSKKWGDFVKSQPYYEQMKKSKLALSEYDAKLNAREEYFLGGWTNFIWDYAGWPIKIVSEKAYDSWKSLNPIKALERATVGYMNTLRILRYLDGMEKLEMQGKNFNDNPEEYKNVADAINTLTGRASLGPFEQSSKILSSLFFSPRNWASVIKTMTPYAFYHFGKMGQKGTFKPSVAQKMAMADFMKYTAITAGVVALVASKYNDDDDEETEVSFDPYSSDFMKIKIGNTRIDPWAGKQQMVVYQARFIMNAITKGGETKKLGEGQYVPTRFDITKNLIENKLAPSLSLLVKWTQQKINKDGKGTLYGKEFEVTDELAGSLYPMYIGTINELWKDQPQTVSAFLTAYAFLGGGVQTYEMAKSKKPEYIPDQYSGYIKAYNRWDAEGWITTPTKEEVPIPEDLKPVISSLIDKKTAQKINKYKEELSKAKDEEALEDKLKKYRGLAIDQTRGAFRRLVREYYDKVDVSKMTPEQKQAFSYEARKSAVDSLQKEYENILDETQ